MAASKKTGKFVANPLTSVNKCGILRSYPKTMTENSTQQRTAQRAVVG